MKRDDRDLLIAWADRGDRDALGELVQRRFPEAFRIARGLLRDDATAEDAAADACALLLRDAASFDRARPFEPWWRSIVLHRARDAARRSGRRARREAAVARAESVSHDPSRALASDEVREKVHALPEDLREPIVLHYYEGLSHEAIGEALGCPTGTASSRLRRGLDELRRSLSPALVPALEELLRGASDRAAPRAPDVASLERRGAKLARASAAKVASAALALVLISSAALVAPRLIGTGGDEGNGAAPPAPIATVTRSATAPVATASPGRATAPVATATEAAPAHEPRTAKADAPAAPVPVAPVADVAARLAVQVRDRHGKPVAGATVGLDLLREPRVGICRLRPETDVEATTDAAGIARFSKETIGESKQVSLFAARGLDEASASIDLGHADARAEVTLVPPDRPRGGRGAIVGRALAGDRPLANVELVVWWKHPGGCCDSYPKWTPTDAEGRYALRDLHAGDYDVSIGPAGRAPARVRADVHAGEVIERDLDLAEEAVLVGRVVVPEKAKDVSVYAFPQDGLQRFEHAPLAADGGWRFGRLAPGKVEVRIQVPGWPERVLEVDARPGTVEVPAIHFEKVEGLVGRVVQHDGSPAADRDVGVRIVKDDGVEAGARTKTDADGKFVVRGIEAARARVLVFVQRGPNIGNMDPATIRVLELGNGADLGTIRLPSFAMPGEDRKIEITGRVLDPEGRPFASALISCGSGRMPDATSDANGAFRFADVPGYTWAPLHLTAYPPTPGLVSPPVKVDLAPAKTDVTIRLEPEATLSGKITGDPEGLAGLEVTATPVTSTSNRHQRQAKVQDDGTFTIRGLWRDRYRVRLMRFPNEVVAPVEVDVAAGARVTRDLAIAPARETLAVEVTGAREMVSGEVVVESTRSHLLAKGFLEDGKATIERVEDGEVSITVVAESGHRGSETWLERTYHATVTIAKGTPGALRLAWPAGEPGSLEGTIEKIDAWRYVWAIGDRLRAKTMVAADGTFWLPKLPAGKYRVVAAKSGYDPDLARAVTVEIAPGTTARLDGAPTD